VARCLFCHRGIFIARVLPAARFPIRRSLHGTVGTFVDGTAANVAVNTIAEAITLWANFATVTTLTVRLIVVFENAARSEDFVASTTLQTQLVPVFAKCCYALSEVDGLSALWTL
jgi:hypothetical protein